MSSHCNKMFNTTHLEISFLLTPFFFKKNSRNRKPYKQLIKLNISKVRTLETSSLICLIQNSIFKIIHDFYSFCCLHDVKKLTNGDLLLLFFNCSIIYWLCDAKKLTKIIFTCAIYQILNSKITS